MRISTLILISASIALVFTGQQALKAQATKPAEQTIYADTKESLKTDISKSIRDYVARQYPRNRVDLYPGLAETCDIDFSDDLKSGTILCEAIKGTFEAATPASKSLLIHINNGGIKADLYYKLTLQKSF